MKVLIIDNYDSFVYNLAQYVGELGAEPLVYRNDQLTWRMSSGACSPVSPATALSPLVGIGFLYVALQIRKKDGAKNGDE